MLRPSLLIVLLASVPALAATTVVDAGPTASTRDVRQVRMRFSDDMVALADSRAADPAAVSCSDPALKAVGHWIDARNWVGEFARALPDGVACTVTPLVLKLWLRVCQKTRSGSALTLYPHPKTATISNNPPAT